MKHGPSTGPDEMPGPASFRMKFPSSVSPQRQTCRLRHPGCEVTTILQWFCESRNLYNQVLSPGGSEHKSFLPSLQLCLQIVRRRRGPRARQGHSVEGHGGSPWLGTGLQGHLIFFVCTSPLTICFSQSWPQDKLPALVLTMLVSKKIQKTQVQMPGSGLEAPCNPALPGSALFLGHHTCPLHRPHSPGVLSALRLGPEQTFLLVNEFKTYPFSRLSSNFRLCTNPFLASTV